MFTTDLDKRQCHESKQIFLFLTMSLSVWAFPEFFGSLNCLTYTVYMENICTFSAFASFPNVCSNSIWGILDPFETYSFLIHLGPILLKYLNSWQDCFLSVWFPTMAEWFESDYASGESVSHSVVTNSLLPQQTVAHQDPLFMEFSRQEYWNE